MSERSDAITDAIRLIESAMDASTVNRARGRLLAAIGKLEIARGYSVGADEPEDEIDEQTARLADEIERGVHGSPLEIGEIRRGGS